MMLESVTLRFPEYKLSVKLVSSIKKRRISLIAKVKASIPDPYIYIIYLSFI